MLEKMKCIRICAKNTAAIETTLVATAGKCTGPTYTSFKEVEEIAHKAEAALQCLGLPLTHRTGASYIAMSGKTNAFKAGCTCTRVSLLRRRAGWYLAHVQQCVATEAEDGGFVRLTISPEQENRSLKHFRKKYEVCTPYRTATQPSKTHVLKPILISSERLAQISDALHAVNGRAYAHTYDSYQIEALANAAEDALKSLKLGPRDRIGATYTSTSGGRVANAYKYPRTATRVTLRRRASGWYLTEIARTAVYPQGGRATLVLTREQDACAFRSHHGQYVVRLPAQLAAEAVQKEGEAVLNEIYPPRLLGDVPSFALRCR